MIKKAKYPQLKRPYMKREEQGFGSLYGGNRNSNILNQSQRRNIINESNEEQNNTRKDTIQFA